MKIQFHKDFVKQYKKQSKKIQKKIQVRNTRFIQDPYHPILNNHALHGRYFGYRSINITGDMRIVYKHISDEQALFVKLGTHSDLYS